MKNPIKSQTTHSFLFALSRQTFFVLLKKWKIKNLALEMRISIFLLVSHDYTLFKLYGGWLSISTERSITQNSINSQGWWSACCRAFTYKPTWTHVTFTISGNVSKPNQWRVIKEFRVMFALLTYISLSLGREE